MLPEELFKKIQGFHFRTRRLANDLFAGQYESAFRGRGMEFAEVREYQPGDDIRTIDWNVSARFGHPFVKVFHEERELTVILLLDLSGSICSAPGKNLNGICSLKLPACWRFSPSEPTIRSGPSSSAPGWKNIFPPKRGQPMCGGS